MTGGMGFWACSLQRQSEAGDVRFGSLAAAAQLNGGVRFTPKSCRDSRRPARPLWAMSGLMHRSKLFDNLISTHFHGGG
jgi:hypothetical protein